MITCDKWCIVGWQQCWTNGRWADCPVTVHTTPLSSYRPIWDDKMTWMGGGRGDGNVSFLAYETHIQQNLIHEQILSRSKCLHNFSKICTQIKITKINNVKQGCVAYYTPVLKFQLNKSFYLLGPFKNLNIKFPFNSCNVCRFTSLIQLYKKCVWVQ